MEKPKPTPKSAEKRLLNRIPEGFLGSSFDQLSDL